jgi:hypothetical protein
MNQKTGNEQDSVNPDQNSVIGGTNDNIINFNINFDEDLPDLTHPIIVQFMIEDGDIYAILGGNRNRTKMGTDLTTPSINITYKYSSITNSANARSIYVQCLYPASLSSDSHIYLRCDLSNNNIQTESLLSQNTDVVGGTNMIPSRIIGKIPIDADTCSYVSYKVNEFFLNVNAKSLNFLRLFITDGRGRPIPDSNLYGSKQNTLGNKSFSCVIKVDVYQTQANQNSLITPPVKQLTNAKFSGVPAVMDLGRNSFLPPPTSGTKQVPLKLN